MAPSAQLARKSFDHTLDGAKATQGSRIRPVYP